MLLVVVDVVVVSFCFWGKGGEENKQKTYDVCIKKKKKKISLFRGLGWLVGWSERRTGDRKVASPSPGRSGGGIFFCRVNFLC